MTPTAARIALALAAPFAVPLAAQRAEAAPTAAAALAQKLAAPFLQVADWTTDLAAAQRRAADRDQLIFGYFTTTGP